MRQTILLTLALLYVLGEIFRPSGVSPPDEGPTIDRPPTEILRRDYSQDAARFFLETAFWPENQPAREKVRKWSENLRLRIYGHPTPLDLDSLEQAVAELNLRLEPIRIELGERASNVEAHFLPSDEIPAHEPNYTVGQPGLYWVWWSRAGVLYRARMVFATDVTTEQRRAVLIRTYLLRVLGLLGRPQDGWDSLLASTADGSPHCTDLDREVVGLLYRPEILPGMSRRTATRLLTGEP